MLTPASKRSAINRDKRATAVRRPKGARKRSLQDDAQLIGNRRFAFNRSAMKTAQRNTRNGIPHLEKNEPKFKTNTASAGNFKPNSRKMSRNPGMTKMLNAVSTMIARPTIING